MEEATVKMEANDWRVSTTERDDYTTFLVETGFLPTDDGDFIVTQTRLVWDKNWNPVQDSLKVQSQVTVSRDHAEALLKVLQEALGK